MANGKELSAADVVDKVLWAKKPVQAYRLPDRTSQKLEIIPAGQAVGAVYGWVKRENVWWMFQYGDGSFFYAEHLPGVFDWDKLIAQFDENGNTQKGIPDWLIVGATILATYQAFHSQGGVKYLWGAASGLGIGYLTTKGAKALIKTIF